ncbi:MAG TPA: tetratricopeptide repeat protein, partial [Chloroflexia bacterium]|nr:tetratricopeptide repeat protein [Chloroflexia bacterium]
GDYPVARARHEESLALRRELDDKAGIANALSNLGEVAEAQADFAAAYALHAAALRLQIELGGRRGIAQGLESLARVAAADLAGDGARRAARLWGVAEALREALGTPAPPPERAVLERAIAAARARLAPATWAAAWAAGRALSPDAASAWALAGPGPAEPLAVEYETRR